MHSVREVQNLLC